MQQETITFVVAGLGIASTIGGILTTHYLTRSWQRKQWEMDRRNDEFRELLGTLTKSFTSICTLQAIMRPQSPEEQRALSEAKSNALMTIRDRIFIAADVKRLEIYKLWKNAVEEYDRDYVYVPFAEKYALINALIVDAATRKV